MEEKQPDVHLIGGEIVAKTKDLLIRDVPIDALERLSTKAKAVDQDRQDYVRALIVKASALPETYAYRVHGQVGRGVIRRYSNHLNGTSTTFSNFNQDEVNVMREAEDFIRRNAPGDRERAYELLLAQFGPDQVFEVPA